MFLSSDPLKTAKTPLSACFIEILPRNIISGGAIHEFRAAMDMAGHIVFAAMLLAELSPHIPILWVSSRPSLHAPGLAWLGLDPARCLFAQGRDDAQSLGTLEVALRGGMAGVAECAEISRLAARRLALAAKAGGSIGLLLRHAPAITRTDSTAFATRWLITPSPSEMGAARMRAELLYAKGGQPGVFMLEIRETEHGATPSIVTLVQPRVAAGAQRRAG